MTPRIDAPPFVEALGAVVGWKAARARREWNRSTQPPPGRRSARARRPCSSTAPRRPASGRGRGGPAIGVAALPGSERVFEPLRKAWEDATTRSTGRPICRSAAAGWSASGAGWRPARRRPRLDLVRYLSGPDVSTAAPRGARFPDGPGSSESDGKGPARSRPSRRTSTPRLWSKAVSQSLMALRVLPGLAQSLRPTATSSTWRKAGRRP